MKYGDGNGGGESGEPGGFMNMLRLEPVVAILGQLLVGLVVVGLFVVLDFEEEDVADDDSEDLGDEEADEDEDEQYGVAEGGD